MCIKKKILFGIRLFLYPNWNSFILPNIVLPVISRTRCLSCPALSALPLVSGGHEWRRERHRRDVRQSLRGGQRMTATHIANNGPHYRSHTIQRDITDERQTLLARDSGWPLSTHRPGTNTLWSARGSRWLPSTQRRGTNTRCTHLFSLNYDPSPHLHQHQNWHQ